MATRPYWSGQIRISLVAFPVTLSGAVKRSAQLPLHEIDRKTGERIHHLNVIQDGTEVERKDIIKGYEIEKNEYVLLEQEEIDSIKLPSSNSLELATFADIQSIPLMRYERPYFILPDGKDSDEIYAVIHQALYNTGKAGIGQFALRGREELCAVIPVEEGLMLHTLRYDAELQPTENIFPDLSKQKPKSDYIALARQLIQKNTHTPKFENFHDHYHEALLELINAKQSHRKPKFAQTKPTARIVNFAEALRKSLASEDKISSRSTSSKRA